jgi:threonine/homoserine/homoserine lactone efflux protein
MLSTQSLMLYAGLYLVAAAVPGPGVIAIVARALGAGFKGTIPASVGMAVGDWVLMTLSALGLAALAKAMGPLFLGVKLAGAAYLLFLAWKYWRAPVSDEAPVAPQRDSLRAFLSQTAMTIGNPKAIAFFVALLPAAVDLRKLTFASYLELTAVTFILIPAVTLTYAALAAQLRGVLADRKSRRAMNRGAALVMAGAAVGVTVS